MNLHGDQEASRRRRLRATHPDAGFTLVEAVVALLILGLVMTGLAAASVAAIRTSLFSRQNQQAGDLIGQQVERYRALKLDAIANVASDMVGDSRVVSCEGLSCLDPGTGTKELLVLDDGGAVVPHLQTVSSASTNNTTFTVAVYVTVPAGQDASYQRRITVFAKWSNTAGSHTRSNSTIVSYGDSGLPLPKFTFAPLGPTEVSSNPGARVHYGYTVTNLGASDHWDVTLTDSSSATWTLVADAGGDQVFTSADTTMLTDTTGNGTVDTGLVQPGQTLAFWAYRDTSATEALGSSVLTVTVRSSGQPDAGTAVQSLHDTTTIVTGAISATPTVSPSGSPTGDCPAATADPTPSTVSGHSLITYFLHNGTTQGDSTTLPELVMSTAAPYASVLDHYSTDVEGSPPGRLLQPGGGLTTGSPLQYADWNHQFGAGGADLQGTAVLTAWVASDPADPATSVALTAHLYTNKKTQGYYQISEVASQPITLSPFTCGGFQKVTAAFSISGVSLSNNDYIGVRLVSSSPKTVRLAYDVVGAYPASLVLPEKP